MRHIIFANPELFLLFVLYIPIIVWYVLRQKQSNASLQVSGFRSFRNISQSYKFYLRHLSFAFRCLALAFVILVLARPQSTDSFRNVNTEGIDIVISMDLSGSMLAQDLRPNRMEAAIDVATEFIGGRDNDKIGLVVFAGESFTQCPLTTDHAVLINLFKDIPSIQLENGTAIGMGLATAVARIKDSEAKSKVIILLTDGENNAGEIAPEMAADLAKSFGIRVYTIGVGTVGQAPMPVQTTFGTQMQMVDVNIDEPLLRRIAANTDGAYFRATDNASLKQIYEEIDQLEKTKIEVKEFSKKKEEYMFFALIGFIFLLAEVILRYTILRTIP